MAKTPSNMLPLGTAAPEFSLPEPRTGRQISLGDYQGQPLLIAFICNHCPYVLHIRSAFAAFARDYASKGLQVLAINANDVEAYPADSPEKMIEECELAGYEFPYLYDHSQAVAQAYQAACTPDFFLFDSSHQLVYRGQFDSSRPGNDQPVTGQDLRLAAEALLAGQPINPEQHPSLGCNIKWRPELNHH